jgi:tetratricopeptide (TPR) repeat protein
VVDRFDTFRAEQARRREVLDAEKKDRQVVAELDEARLRAANHKDGNYDTKATVESYLAAFRAYGIDVATLPVEDAARRIRTSKVADVLISALDDWGLHQSTTLPSVRVLALARAADVDPVRAAIAKGDAAGLRQRIERAEDRDKLGPQLRTVFQALLRLEPAASFQLLETIRGERPSDFWINHELGMAYRETTPPQAREAERCLTVAVALRPESPGARVNLGNALRAQGKLDLAVESFRKAIQINPDLAAAHSNLGIALNGQGKLDLAVESFRKATQIQPDFAAAHSNLGNVLRAQGKLDQAVESLREAIRLKPDLATAHYNLGITLRAQGKLDQAVESYRKAIRFKPDYAEAHCNLGLLLGTMGRFREALELLEQGHALGSKLPDWQNPSQEWVRQHRRFLELDTRLPEILKGEAKPTDAAERLELATVCYRKGLHAASARFADEAFAEKPALANNPQTGSRYNAACSASLAGSGQGKDETMPDEEARIKLRKLALGWLQSDLAIWSKILDGGNEPARKQAVLRTLAHWREDADLAGIRDAEALVRLPEAEREAWKTFWADVEALHKRAQGPKP